MPELESVLPKYLQIAGHIKDQIVRGDLRHGDEVASEREIAANWGVARPTAARALEALRVQGLVVSRQGAGTFVRGVAAAPRARERFDRARDLGSMYGAAERVEFLQINVVPGPKYVTEALGLPPASEVICRARRLFGADGTAIELPTSWFAGDRARRAPRLLEPERLLGGTAKYLAEVGGPVAAYARDQVSARLGTATELELLGLGKQEAVLVYWLTLLDDQDAPIQFDAAVYPPEHWAFRQEYPVRS